MSTCKLRAPISFKIFVFIASADRYLAGGVDALVALAGANDAYARHEAQMALAALEENITSEKESTMCDQQLAHADLVSLLRAVASATPVSPRRS